VVGAVTLLAGAMAAARPSAPGSADPAVTLVGRLQVGEFFGPPNYGESPDTDRLERTYYLQLPAPPGIQVDRLQLPEDADSSAAWFHFVQLIVPDSLSSRARQLVGQRVAATGVLLTGVTGHHRTPLLLDVQTLRPLTTFR